MNWGDKMEKVKIGKVVTTHGIRGEIRILSSFPYKEKVFGVGKKIWIDGVEYTIVQYRVHKGFDMVVLDGFSNINDVLFLLKKDVFVEKEEIGLSPMEILDEDLIQYRVLTKDGKSGIIKEIFYAGPDNKVLRVQFDREVLIPFFSPMILEISPQEKTILVEIIEGM